MTYQSDVNWGSANETDKIASLGILIKHNIKENKGAKKG